MLENVEIGEQKRRDDAYKAAKKKTGIYDDKFNDDPSAEKKIQMSGVFTLMKKHASQKVKMFSCMTTKMQMFLLRKRKMRLVGGLKLKKLKKTSNPTQKTRRI
jgi:hypothetical protein